MPLATALDGTRIAYDVEGSGPPVVLLHGITEDRGGWRPIVERLGDDFTCIAIDARGHGESAPAATGYDTITMAGDVAAVVGDVALDEPPLVVGQSMGAALATVYAAVGGPARAVVNVDQTLRLTDFAAMLRPLEAELRGAGFATFMSAMVDALGVDALPPDAAAHIRASMAAADPDVVLGIWGQLFEMSDAELSALVDDTMLPGIHVPYLALHGAHPGDDYVDWLTARVPTATVEVWDGDGHWLHLVEPDRFARRVRDFAAGA